MTIFLFIKFLVCIIHATKFLFFRSPRFKSETLFSPRLLKKSELQNRIKGQTKNVDEQDIKMIVVVMVVVVVMILLFNCIAIKTATKVWELKELAEEFVDELVEEMLQSASDEP